MPNCGSGCTLQITLTRSPIGYIEKQKRTARALGLTRMQQTVVQPDNAAIRGMVKAISHMVTVVEIEPPAPVVETPPVKRRSKREAVGAAEG